MLVLADLQADITRVGGAFADDVAAVEITTDVKGH
jgi:hypothetical protein